MFANYHCVCVCVMCIESIHPFVCMLWHLCFHYLTFFAVYFTISHIFLAQAQMEKAHRAQPAHTASRFSSHYHLSISNSFDFIHFFSCYCRRRRGRRHVKILYLLFSCTYTAFTVCTCNRVMSANTVCAETCIALHG